MNTYVEEVFESEHVCTYTKRLYIILDSKYTNPDLHKVMKNQCKHLIKEKLNGLLKLLPKPEDCFDGTISTWKANPVDFE